MGKNYEPHGIAPVGLLFAHELALPAASARLLDNRFQLSEELASHDDVDLDDADARSRPSQFKCALEGCRVRLHALKVSTHVRPCARSIC